MWSSFLNVIIFSSIQSSLSLWDLFSWPYQGHFRTRTFNLKQVIFKKGDTNEMNSIASSPSWLCAPVEKVPKANVLFVHPCSSSWNFHSHFERSEDREFYSFNIVGGIFFCLASETLFHILTTSGICHLHYNSAFTSKRKSAFTQSCSFNHLRSSGHHWVWAVTAENCTKSSNWLSVYCEVFRSAVKSSN